MPTRKIAGYGWRPDHPDRRDHKLAICRAVPTPPHVDLSTSKCMPAVYDQGELGSCTANAIAAAIDFERAVQGEPFITPSRLFVYFNERAIEGDTANDSGAEIRDGIKVVASQGVCPESVWPYDEAKFADKPDDGAYAAALMFKAVRYASVNQGINDIKNILGAVGRPVVFGMNVYDEFESDEVAASGVVIMPAANQAPVGGHAVLIVGYDDSSQRFKIRNSWGPDWGQKGYCTIPYRYLLDPDLASDFWVITLES
jgi:C1A family cysteine protease